MTSILYGTSQTEKIEVLSLEQQLSETLSGNDTSYKRARRVIGKYIYDNIYPKLKEKFGSLNCSVYLAQYGVPYYFGIDFSKIEDSESGRNTSSKVFKLELSTSLTNRVEDYISVSSIGQYREFELSLEGLVLLEQYLGKNIY